MSKPPAPGPDSPIAEAPLEELSRDRLSVFLFVCFTPEELLEAVKRLGLTVPGYRQEHLSDIDRADLIADEVRASRHVRRLVGERLRAALGRPALADDPLEPGFATRLAEAVADEDGLQRLLWRLLSDRRPEVRAAAAPALDRLVDELYADEGPEEAAAPAGPASAIGAAATAPVAAAGGPGTDAIKARLREAAREVRQAERERDRAVRERDRTLAVVAKLRDQLHEARAGGAAATRELSNARKAARAATARAEKLEAALAQARGKPGAALAARLRRDLEKAEHRLAALEAERTAGPPAVAAGAALPADGGAVASTPVPPEAPHADGLEEAPPAWLLPVYTREFYDSLRGWDRRIQRAAFKQAHLLAQDHRHPSLRALPLEGLPNLYRVRVATDVRLLYRRGEGNTVELLSLIDREDLDRYIKQAKERG